MTLDKIFIASANKGKISEIKAKLNEFKLEFSDKSEFKNIEEPEENGKSFYENALIKAKYYSSITGLPALADDSGLAVETLEGKPGIHSSRFAGENAKDEENNQKLLTYMIGEKNRNAKFVCQILLFINDDEIISAKGIIEGQIVSHPRGDYGFGYDPLFYLPEYNKTMAEIKPEIKNKISHRAKALDNLYLQIKNKIK